VTAETTLENCASEPIHIPGTIQSHGALLAFDMTGNLCFASANAAPMLGVSLLLDQPMIRQGLPSKISDMIAGWLDDPTADFEPFDTPLAGRDVNVLGHRNVDGLLVVEFEPRSESATTVSSFALIAHKAIERLRRQVKIENLLGLATAEIRKITGFDRVMAYRFRHDDSGEVVRESRRDDLPDWEGRRYPSSDIPDQARRLYVLNTLRLIASVDSQPVAVLASGEGMLQVLDMSLCGLRSVSPIHIEYLMNMGVVASLSISIVVDGKLWGMIACHHGAARHVPHGIRMACEVLGQMLSLTVSSIESAAMAARALRSADTLAQIGLRARAADDLLAGVAFDEPNPSGLVDADAMVCIWGGKMKVCAGTVPPDVVKVLAGLLETIEQDTVVSARVAETHPLLAAAVHPFCGILAVCFDAGHRGWAIWLRSEQIDHVRWAGKPEKTVRIGPNGPRLTPRGSFTEWLEEVRGSSVPWDRGDVETASKLRAELNLIAGVHAIEMERVRLELLASLGHDLRDPLQSISLAAQILQRKSGDGVQLGARIESSSGRMGRLVTQILDMSRLQSNSGITLMPDTFDLVELLNEIVNDTTFVRPGAEVALVAPAMLTMHADRDRLAQVVSNLLSNARHHGVIGMPITVFARVESARVLFGVSNHGDPIAQTTRDGLFKAFRPESANNPRNRTGLGLGLYISTAIVEAHGGTLELECADGMVTFVVDIAVGQK
jgi:two-component system, chemotaxis family, sensor kinase Cph1